jgi:hypothetical protein
METILVGFFGPFEDGRVAYTTTIPKLPNETEDQTIRRASRELIQANDASVPEELIRWLRERES